ncbi:MAG: hypothetical protein RL701_1231 [Pseudomonadota bacterium]|jgi:cobalt-zinc-cadmium efflux system outer membrane protein
MRVSRIALRLFLAVWSAPAFAQNAEADTRSDPSTSEVWQLEYRSALELIDEAPGLRAQAAANRQLRAAKAGITSLPSDLQLTAELGPRVAPSLAVQGRIAVSQGFMLSNLGDARRVALESRAVVGDSERMALRVLRRLNVSDAWLRVHTAHAASSAMQVELALADELARVSERGAQLGELTRADAADALAYAAEAKLGALAAEGELTDAKFDLMSSLAISERFVDVRADPPAVTQPTPERVRTVLARMQQLPVLARLNRRLDWLGTRARELRAQYSPQVTLGVALDRTDPTAWAGLATLGFSIPVRDRGARDRAELESERTVLRGEAAEQAVELRIQIERLLHEIAHSTETLQHLDERLLPAVDRGLAAREALFRSGEGTVLEIIVARRAALGLRVRRVRLHAARQSALLRFEELALAAGVSS